MLFAIPWYDRTLVGTTEVATRTNVEEPVPSRQEIDFILEHFNRYFNRKARREDILSVFAGLRPLVRRDGGIGAKTAALSRSHTIEVLRGNVVSIMGGKWTTYRKMAEDTVDRVIGIGGFKAGPSVTADLPLEGAHAHHSEALGSPERAPADAHDSAVLPGLGELLHPSLPYRKAEIVRAVRHEWAWNLEDVLARRTRSLLLDARASIEAAPEAARLMAVVLGRDRAWRENQVEQYRTLARKYLPD